MQVDEAADHVMLTTEMADALHVDAVEGHLRERQTAFSLCNEKLQELQASGFLH